MKGEKVDTDWCGGFAEGSTLLIGYNNANVTEEMKADINAVEEKIKAGEIKVFDTSTFTVTAVANDSAKTDADGHLTEYMADAVADEAFTPDTQVVNNGEFQESTVRSAPYFNIIIDGVTAENPS